jgi:ferredoxin--NADP+ reductase
MDHDPTNATLVLREDLTEALSIVRVKPDEGAAPDFVPGQFVRLGLPRPRPAGGTGRVRYTRRAYSIGSSPLEKGHLEFFVVLIEEGELTPKLWNINVGDRLWMDNAAKGEFNIDLAPPAKDLVMVSSGTGIAPFLSMLRTFRGQGRWRRFVLINGVRLARDLGYRDELEAVAREDPTVTYIPLASREPEGSDWTGLRGRVQAALETGTYERLVGAPLDPRECHVFLCGNPQMIDDVEALLVAHGFETDQRDRPGNIHFERYW